MRMAPKGIALHARPAAGGASMIRERKALLLSVAAILVTPGIGAEEQTLRYRAEHLFTLPVEMSRAMLAFGGPKDWRHFPRHTRHIDVDGDGGHDFIAIALGVSTEILQSYTLDRHASWLDLAANIGGALLAAHIIRRRRLSA